MEIFVISITVVILYFIGIPFLKTIFALGKWSKLSPESSKQIMYWRTMHNNASAAGDLRMAKLCKTKELLVYTTDHPIMPFMALSAPYLCIEGKLEEKTDEELDELIEYYETMSDGERSKLLRDRKT
jgi:hypothetical protein